jgi:hypothetical protein
MKKSVYFCLLLLVVLNISCRRLEQQQKKIGGTWKVDVVRIEDGEGFLFYDSLAEGDFTFHTNLINGQSAYKYSYFGQYDVADSVVFNNLKYSLGAKGEVLQIERPTDTLHAKIILLTKDRLTFEYYDFLQYRLKRFSCVKN